jgi:hypothetical protein
MKVQVWRWLRWVLVVVGVSAAIAVHARQPAPSVKVIYFEGLSYAQLNTHVLTRGGPAVTISIPANEPNTYSIRYEGDYVLLTSAQNRIIDLPYSLFFFGVFPGDVIEAIPNNDLCPEGVPECENMIDYFGPFEVSSLDIGHSLAIRVSAGCAQGIEEARKHCPNPRGRPLRGR